MMLEVIDCIPSKALRDYLTSVLIKTHFMKGGVNTRDFSFNFLL